MSTECKNAPQCAPAKHHYDDCAARVQKQEAEGEVTEDCVEECTFSLALYTFSLLLLLHTAAWKQMAMRRPLPPLVEDEDMPSRERQLADMID